MKRRDYFVTSGEVLIRLMRSKAPAQGETSSPTCNVRSLSIFIEVLWGENGRSLSATDLPAFGRRQSRIPFSASGKKWVRFAAWDSAGNGALVQHVKFVP
jgi:hypothetical protein